MFHQYNFIRIVEIKKTFKENKYTNHKTVLLNPFSDQLLELNKKTSIYEIIKKNDTIKFFMDIEKVPKEAPYLIFEIAEKFKNYMSTEHNINFTDYIVTINLESNTHNGFSYHVIYDGVYSTIYDVGAFVNDFTLKNNFVDFIDNSVYTSVRLFKLPLQFGVNSKGKHKRDKSSLNYHQLFYHKTQSALTIQQNFMNQDINSIFPNITINLIKNIHTKDFIEKTIIQNVPPNSLRCECKLPKIKKIDQLHHSGPHKK